MSKGRGQSTGRKRRRGHTDMMGRPLQKRPFNNKKRTKGRKQQAQVQEHYSQIMKRMRHIKSVAKSIRGDIHVRTELRSQFDENWKKVWRDYSNSNMLLDKTEQEIFFKLVNEN